MLARTLQHVRVLIAALLGTLAFAAPATADTYCVAPATGCDVPHTATSIQNGLDLARAHPGDDVVQLGATTYSLDLGNTPLTYPVTALGFATLKGLGPAQTTISSPTAIGADNAAIGGAFGTSTAGGLSVTDLKMSITGAGGAPETDGAAISTQGTLFTNLEIDMLSAGNIGIAVEHTGAATVRNVKFVSVPALPNFSTCLEATPGGPSLTLTVVDITASNCQLDLASPNVNATVERANISSPVGIFAGAGPGTQQIEDSVISTSGIAIHAINQADVLISQSTIVGPGSAGTGVWADNQGVTSLTKVRLYDSIVRGFGLATGLRTTSSGSPSHPASLTGDYDAYEIPTGTSNPGTTFSIPHFVVNTDPQFTNPPSDLTLMATSPVLDRDPAVLGANVVGESATDIAGNARIVGSKRDLGAYERPNPSAATNDATAITQAGASLSGTANEGGPAGGGTAQFVYGTTTAYGSTLPSHALATSGDGVAITDAVGGLTPGTTYHFALRVQTALGTVTSSDRTFTTAAAPSGGPPGGGPPGGGPTTTIPVIRALSLSPSKFKAAHSGSTLATPPKKRAAGGATLTISLNVAATVTFTVTRQDRGVRKGKTCVARGHGRRGAPCMRAVKLGSTSKALGAGTTRLRFSARVSSHALKPAVYVLTANPRGGKAKTVKFTVKR